MIARTARQTAWVVLDWGLTGACNGSKVQHQSMPYTLTSYCRSSPISFRKEANTIPAMLREMPINVVVDSRLGYIDASGIPSHVLNVHRQAVS